MVLTSADFSGVPDTTDGLAVSSDDNATTCFFCHLFVVVGGNVENVNFFLGKQKYLSDVTMIIQK